MGAAGQKPKSRIISAIYSHLRMLHLALAYACWNEMEAVNGGVDSHNNIYYTQRGTDIIVGEHLLTV